FDQLNQMLELLGNNALYEQVLQERVSESSIRPLSASRYAPERLYEAEKMLFDTFKRRSKQKNDPIVKELDAFLAKSDFQLGEQQRAAVEMINNGHTLLCLVGYAGTGKSTTSRTILDLLSTLHDEKEIMTCALSGIASQRIADTTGYSSATIQSLLVRYEEHDTMPFKVLLIDESSMINSMLFARLFSKIDRDCVVVLVGDDAQLPPIGAGNILSDILELSLSPIVKLTKIYRQSEEQAIALIANDIRQSHVPHYRREYDDFHFRDISIPNYYALRQQSSKQELEAVREENSKAILAAIIETAMRYIPTARKHLQAKEISRYLNAFQVITPMKGGLLGTDSLNTHLQEYFNPKPKKKIIRGEREFRLMDKVVHIKNENMPSNTLEGFKEGGEESERRIFNGMSGLLFRIDEEEEQLYVIFPNEAVVVRYEYDQLKSHLMLSYALTIHKVQGMEYDVITMPMTFSHFIMLNTKLLYTAITRAKAHCYVIGESQAFERACKRLEVTKRDTVLRELGSSQTNPKEN
ncbi:MAG: ATPase, partial [Epsilonproteobacteria bacterium]